MHMHGHLAVAFSCCTDQNVHEAIKKLPQDLVIAAITRNRCNKISAIRSKSHLSFYTILIIHFRACTRLIIGFTERIGQFILVLIANTICLDQDSISIPKKMLSTIKLPFLDALKCIAGSCVYIFILCIIILYILHTYQVCLHAVQAQPDKINEIR